MSITPPSRRLTVSDGKESDTDEVVIEVIDTTKPTITCPGDITVEAVDTIGVPAGDGLIQDFLNDAVTDDDFDSAVDVTTNAPAMFAIGATSVTFTATDDSGNSSSCGATVTVLGSKGIISKLTEALNPGGKGKK